MKARINERVKPKRILPAYKRRQITGHLLEAILQGKFKPGERLPTRRELEKKLDVSTATVQTALDQLGRDGFVSAQGRHGTFVSKQPPHLTRFGLAFPHTVRHGATWNLFYQSLVSAAEELGRQEGCEFQFYFGVDEEPEENRVRLGLIEDALAHRLAGVIFAREPHFLAGSTLLTSPEIPRVAIASARTDFPCVWFDYPKFMERGLDYLLQRGRRRIAVIMAAVIEGGEVVDECLDSALLARNLNIPSYWKLHVPVVPPASGRNTVHLLMRCDQSERPDGLLVTDNNVLEAVCGGLMDAGALLGGSLDIVAHGNFPGLPMMAWPVRRLGFDARTILASCMQAIAMQRRGEAPAALTLVPPLFENELAASISAVPALG